MVRLLCLLTLALLAVAQKADAKLTITRDSYLGWSDSIRVSNGTVDIVVVPQIGRIVHYGFTGGKNILWLNSSLLGKTGKASGDWQNFGGDKVWPWPQDDWPKRQGTGWPPPPAADSLAHQAEIVGAGKEAFVRLTSSAMLGFGARAIREIRLAETGTDVTILSRIEKVRAGAVFPLAAWSILQIPHPQRILARRLPNSTLTDGWKKFGEGTWQRLEAVELDFLSILQSPSSSAKIGIDADILAAVLGDTLLTVHSLSARETGFVDGDRAQIYSNPPGLAYVELEFTAPLKALQCGEISELKTVWQLRRLSESERADDAKLMGIVRGL